MPDADTSLLDPRAEYNQRLSQYQTTEAHCARRDGRYSTLRGLTFIAGIAIFVIALNSALMPAELLAIPCVLFLALVILHSIVVGRRERATRAIELYQQSIARLDDDWAHDGYTGERYRDSQHAYSADLDLYGNGSLFQLLSAARTRLGEDTLADWLNAPASIETIEQRQRAVREIAPKIQLREDMALLNAEIRDELDQTQLLKWSEQTPHPIPIPYRLIAVVLAMATIASLIGILFFRTGISPLMLSLIGVLVFQAFYGRQIKRLFKSANAAGSGLAILSQVLKLLEAEQFQTPRLQEIRRQLDTDGLPPSRCIKRLHQLIQNLNNSLENQFFAPLAFALCLPVHIVHAIEMWRKTVGPRIPFWLNAVGEFEALSSMARYTFEHPDDPFPEFADTSPLFDAEQLGHPLLPENQCVRNDLIISDQRRLIMVSGSNMSGKSTLLRTIGTNVVLAFAGAPVCARRLKLSPLRIGTAMRVNDSLQDGQSYFYAVVARLKRVVELAGGERPLLYLLDEILQGTNSHDRRVGAEGVIRSLFESGSVGLVTTHDLALTKIVDSFDGRAINIHFEDHIANGRMQFDYQIHEGVVQKSNALELMRMMGLTDV